MFSHKNVAILECLDEIIVFGLESRTIFAFPTFFSNFFQISRGGHGKIILCDSHANVIEQIFAVCEITIPEYLNRVFMFVSGDEAAEGAIKRAVQDVNNKIVKGLKDNEEPGKIYIALDYRSVLLQRNIYIYYCQYETSKI